MRFPASLFFLLLVWNPALWGQGQQGAWLSVGTGDCPGRDVGGSTGPNPEGNRCNSGFDGYTAVCWSGNCTYKNAPTASCTGGANPGRMYTCKAASSSQLTASIDPAESTVASGGSVHLKAIVSGGAPPYSYEWRNGNQPSKVTDSGVSWTNLNRLGDRDIVLTVRDAAGSSVQARAAIHVQDAGNASTASPQPGGAVVNLALRKPATQSSVYRGTGVDQGPQFGNDGILDAQPRDPYMVVITDPNDPSPPWWQVDLQGVYTLTQLKLYNRKACCQDRAKTVQVMLSTDGSHWDRAYAHDGTTFDMLTVDLAGRSARYVKLQLAERTSLNFQECEVLGYANAPPAQTIPSQPPSIPSTIGEGAACSMAGDWVLATNGALVLSLRQSGSQLQGTLAGQDPFDRPSTPAPASGSLSGRNLKMTIDSPQGQIALDGGVSADCSVLNLTARLKNQSQAIAFHRP